MSKCLNVIGMLLVLLFFFCCGKKEAPQIEVPDNNAHATLAEIDSLMWQQPDSALAVLLDYLGNDGRDGACTVSTNETFDNHYAQLLASELLFKNDYAQTNRKELLQAVAYFDSLMQVPEPVEGPSNHIAFLTARAHYINGAGYYEQGDFVNACTEYLNTLRIMEKHFAENELVGHKARFMALTYNRLLELFESQLMPEPAIYCARQSLVYTQIAPTSQYGEAKLLNKIGKEYDILDKPDSAVYYYEKTLEALPDRNNLVYRDLISSWSYFEYNHYHDTITALDSLKNMVAQTTDKAERITRYSTIGSIYYEVEQYDSAKFYLEPVLEKDPNRAIIAAKCLKDIALKEGDTLKANQYSQVIAIEGATAAENQILVSKLNDLFQNYLQEKQEAASLHERKKAVRLTLMVLVPLLLAIGLAVTIVMRRRHRKRLTSQEVEAQQQLNEALQRHDEAERELQTKVEQAAQHTREMLQQHVTDIYQSNSKDRMQRICEAIDNTYPQAVARLKAEHPELSETELNILLLNFLHFRIKEEADLLGLSENTVGKYRSNLGKTLGKDPISDWV